MGVRIERCWTEERKRPKRYGTSIAVRNSCMVIMLRDNNVVWSYNCMMAGFEFDGEGM